MLIAVSKKLELYEERFNTDIIAFMRLHFWKKVIGQVLHVVKMYFLAYEKDMEVICIELIYKWIVTGFLKNVC